jgi:hypothetical protein
MNDINKLFVYGCSLTKDNYIKTWADLLAEKFDYKLSNFAERGAGYTYITQKILECDNFDNALCVIMWPSADRLDLYVNSATPHLVTDINNASWLDGKKASFVDYNGGYNNQTGWYMNGAVPRGYKHYYYKFFYNQTTHVNAAWASIVSIQNYLNHKGVKYVMCNSYPLLNLIQYQDDGVCDFNYKLYQQINLDKFVKNADVGGFIELAKKNNYPFFNTHYPSTDAHEWYLTNYIIPKL